MKSTTTPNTGIRSTSDLTAKVFLRIALRHLYASEYTYIILTMIILTKDVD